MQVFAETFVPIEVGKWWFGSQPCPACATHTLHPVANLAPPRWLCSSCGRCWTPRHGHLDRVDPWTCAGCATRHRRECIVRVQPNAPDPGREHSPPSSESHDERNQSLIGHWEFLAHLAHAQGWVCVQADCTADEALMLMQERARATNHHLVEIAKEVLAHRISFD